MSSISDGVLFETFRAVGSAFLREAHVDLTFDAKFNENREYWNGLTQGLTLSTFCHLVETEYGNKDNFRSQLKIAIHKEILDILFYIRNSFIHCNWDISKLNFKNQEEKIRNFVINNPYLDSSFDLQVEDNIVKCNNYEPICRMLLNDV
ncbi:hypothetical protein [uncultured Paraglaciecola sp.]|jgi:hypothetical protein|uniref:hypothetical protein n=1 Tax=uncultured Paraglaciecola sp. TaxID=1765024 RepID=UPI0025E28BB6|nr:hypothetical protein [uncultured Paraglaciecola sp.]